jgi:CubicO group peptidase (beta-lactamase class C family)
MQRLLLALLFTAAPAFAAIDDATIARIDAVFTKNIKSDAPGCAVGISRDGDVFTRGYGMANLEYDIPITADTVFEAGSVSKQFTAAAVVMLARDGKLSLDDHISKYVDLPETYKDVTIRQMLSHTSGIRDWGTLVGLAGWPRGTRQDNHTHVMEILRRQRALNFTPARSGRTATATTTSRR